MNDSNDDLTKPDLEKFSSDEVAEVRKLLAYRSNQYQPIQIKIPSHKVTENDKEAWRQMLISGEPFSKSYKLCSGALSVTFRVKTKEEEDDIISQMNKDSADGVIRDSHQYASRANLYNLFVQTSRLNGKDLEGLKKGLKPDFSLRDQADGSIFRDKKMTAPQTTILLVALSVFESTVNDLINAGVDQEFFDQSDAS